MLISRLYHLKQSFTTTGTKNITMLFKLSSPAVATATYTAIATFSTLSSIHHTATAFTSPSFMNKRSIMGQEYQQQQQQQHQHQRFSILSSTATPIEEAEDTASSSEIKMEKVEPTVIATAFSRSFVPSPNGLGGVMAVKLREEEYNADSELAAAAASAATPKVEGDEKLLSQTGMFGGNANTKKSNKQQKEVHDLTGKTVQFENGKTGTVIAQRPPMAFVLCDFAEWEDNKNDNSEDGTKDDNEIISILSSRTSVSLDDHLFGSIIDCNGKKMMTDGNDNDDEDGSTISRAIFSPIPQISDIALINSPLLTGNLMVDALAPIGKGQNMLLIGQESGVGQREIMIGAIKAQIAKNKDDKDNNDKKVKCVYALTTQDSKVREETIQQLKDENILDDIIVVAARDHGMEESDGVLSSAEAITVAATACTIAEAFALARGDDTFVVVDNIDEYKSFWDWTTRVLVDIYGVDAVVKDDLNGGASSEMRGFYSSLIQRAGRFNKKNGGGSMTLSLLTNLEGEFGDDDEEDITFSPDEFAGSSEKIKQRIAILVDRGISLTPETLRKIQIPVPVASVSEKKRRLALQHVDDLVSMSDGQIWFDEALYASGQRPAIDPQRSITRIGIGADTPCRADAPAMRGLAGGLRFDFAQAASLEGAGEGSGAEKQLLKRDAYLLAMHQNPGEVRSLSENCVVLLASSLGLLDATVKEGGTGGTEMGTEKIKSLLNHVWQSSPSSMEDIDQTLDLSDSVRSELETIIKEFLE